MKITLKKEDIFTAIDLYLKEYMSYSDYQENISFLIDSQVFIFDREDETKLEINTYPELNDDPKSFFVVSRKDRELAKKEKQIEDLETLSDLKRKDLACYCCGELQHKLLNEKLANEDTLWKPGICTDCNNIMNQDKIKYVDSIKKD